jgi:AcrR family transcriptional regulator
MNAGARSPAGVLFAWVMPRPKKTAPMRKAPGDYHHGNLRRALLDAAVVLLEERGGQGFTLREAARRVGVDHRAAYKHFADIDALLAEVAEEGYRDLAAAARAAAQSPSDAEAPSRLLAIARAYVTFATRAPGRYRLMTGPRLNEGGRFPKLEQAIDVAFALVKDVVHKGVAERTLAPVDVVEATLTLWAAMHGFASLVIMRRIRVRRDQMDAFTDRAIGHTVRGLTR